MQHIKCIINIYLRIKYLKKKLLKGLYTMINIMLKRKVHVHRIIIVFTLLKRIKKIIRYC